MKYIWRTAFWLSLVLVVLVPLNAFLVTALFGGGIVSVWKELVIGLLFGIALLDFRNWGRVFYLVCGFVVVGVGLTLALKGFDLGIFAYGGRTEFAFLLLLAAWSVLFRRFSAKDLAILKKGFFVSLVIVLVFGVLLLIFGHDVLVHFGYRNDWSSFYVGESPAFCQKEAGTEFCRLQATFAGPNRYGGFLLAGLAGLLWRRNWLWAAVALVSLGFTLSLSAWIGLFVMAVAALIYKRRWLLKWVIGGVGVLVILGLGFLLFGDEVVAKLSATDQDHLRYGIEALKLWWAQPFGYGLGFIGPASMKLGAPLLSENWFLQVLVNLGVVGLGLFLAIFWEVLRGLWRRGGVGLLGFVAVLGLLAQNFFLHTLEDSGVFVAMVLFACIGLASESWFSAKVVKGKGIGREIGFPTVNFEVGKVNFSQGVYAGRVRFLNDGKVFGDYPAAINYGGRPTFDDDEVLMEAFVLEFDQGFAKALKAGYLFEVKLLSRVRAVKKFAGVEELKMQIGKDIEKVKKILAC